MHYPAPARRHSKGLTRREVLQIGSSGLAGVGLPSVLTGRTQAIGPEVQQVAGWLG
jgi:hypothetical protein